MRDCCFAYFSMKKICERAAVLIASYWKYLEESRSMLRELLMPRLKWKGKERRLEVM